MATSRAKKEDMLQSLIQDFSDARSVVFVDLHGLSVEDNTALRKALREKGVKTKVAKKTLIMIAGKKNGYEIEKSSLEGQIAVAFSMKDEIAAAQELYKAGKKNEKIKLLGGIFEKKIISKDLMLQLAALPSKEELLAKLVGSLKSPLSGLHSVLSGSLRGFVQVLKQLSEKKTA